MTGWPPSLSLLFPCVGAGLQPGILIAPSGPQRSDRGFFSISSEEFRYPLTLNISQIVAADGTLSQQTTSNQKFKHNTSDPSFASAIENEVTTTDTAGGPALALYNNFDLVFLLGAPPFRVWF